jgi:fermentation-respiration switch protein FrsA (DUF1100 family)
VPLDGWVMERDPQAPWIVWCHGFGTNRSDVLEFVRFLSQAGYNVLAFDFRGHGESGGGRTSFGWWERRDLEGAIRFLRDRSAADTSRCGLFGISMGAAVALQTAAHPGVAVVVADSSYTDLDASIRRHIRLLWGLPERLFAPPARLAYWALCGHDPRRVSPLAALGRAPQTAVLIINGALDPRMTPRDAESLYEAARGPRQLWLVPGAGHLESYAVAGAEYERRVVEFFDQHLKTAASPGKGDL